MKSSALLFLIMSFAMQAMVPTLHHYDLEEKKIICLENWEIHKGDHTEWMDLSGEDAIWKIVSFWRTLPEGDNSDLRGSFWIRTHLELTGTFDKTDPLSLFFIKLPSAFEVYWDGVLIGRNGIVGHSRETEKPGKIRGFIPLPFDRATPGRHTLSLRVSNFHIQSKAHRFGFLFGYQSAHAMSLGQKREENLIYMGLFLTAFLFSLFIFLGGWHYFPAIFFCLFTLFQLLDNLWAFLFRTEVIDMMIFYRFYPIILSLYLISFLPLNLFVIWHLNLFRKKTLSMILFAGAMLRLLLLFVVHWDFWQLDLFIAILLFLLIIYQTWMKKKGSASTLMGYGAFLINWGAGALIPVLPFLSFVLIPYLSLIPSSIFLVGLMGSITIKMREQFHALESLRNRSQRLEAELLKKSIQPHFIMNTLLSIKSFLVIDSTKAEKLIEALADEFRLINRIAGESQIPLQEEIDLCRLHLEMMGYRRQAQYELTVEGAYQDLNIPPLILHTLIENGLTHAFKPKENGHFHLTCRKDGKRIVLRLENAGSELEKLSAHPRETIEEGMGLRYIRARLSESYPDKWQLDYGVADGVWHIDMEWALA